MNDAPWINGPNETATEYNNADFPCVSVQSAHVEVRFPLTTFSACLPVDMNARSIIALAHEVVRSWSLRNIESEVLRAYSEAFPAYAWTGAEPALDMLRKEIAKQRKEKLSAIDKYNALREAANTALVELFWLSKQVNARHDGSVLTAIRRLEVAMGLTEAK